MLSLILDVEFMLKVDVKVIVGVDVEVELEVMVVVYIRGWHANSAGRHQDFGKTL